MTISKPCLAGLACFLVAGVSLAGDYEQPPLLHAAHTIDPELLVGPHYRVADEVHNDGLMNHYLIESDFGRFDAGSRAALLVRLAEVDAIARLKELGRSEIFLRGVGKAGKRVLDGATGLLLHPLSTTRAAAGGVKELFGDVAEGTQRALGSMGGKHGDKDGEGDEGDSEPLVTAQDAQDVIGYSRAIRDYAFEFGVDPYSSNPVLQTELRRISKAGFIGDFTAGSALGLVAGPAGIAVTVASTTESFASDIRDYGPGDLRKMNQALLAAMGVDDADSQAFLDNPVYTPTYQTALTRLLNRLGEVRDRGVFVRAAARAGSEPQAVYFMGVAALYRHYLSADRPLARFVAVGRRVLAIDDDGVVIEAGPFDYVAWTPGNEAGVEAADAVIASLSQQSRRKLMLVAGALSERTRGELLARHWALRTGIGIDIYAGLNTNPSRQPGGDSDAH